MKAEQRVVVIGEMRELGEYTLEEHEKIAILAKKLNAFAQIILVGNEFRSFAAHATAFFETASEAKIYIDAQKFATTHIYIKGSRSVKLEVIV